VLLLLLYNVARFGNPLEVGQSYALSGVNPKTAHLSSAAFILPNLWYYGLSPPRPTILFPFLALGPPPSTYPLTYPAGYGLIPEVTGGLLAMTPLLLFAFALPWLRRRSPQLVEPIASPLLIASVAGVLALLFLSYEFFGTTERYEADFAAVFLLTAIAGWFALSSGAPSWRRRAIRLLGAALAAWGCFTGIAISFAGYGGNASLQATHPGTFRSLENATSPISTAIAAVVGHPVLARVEAPELSQVSPLSLTTIGAGIESFALVPGYPATLTIVSPDRRTAAIVANIEIGRTLGPGATLSLSIHDASSRLHEFRVLHNGVTRLPVELNRGLNRVTLTPGATAVNPPNPTLAADNVVLVVRSLTLAAHY
jgi:hypothetical protein